MKEDSVLVERTLDGDMQAFRWLITKHQGLVAHVVRRIVPNSMEVEEVCQDVFMKVHDKLQDFRRESKFTTWLVTIAYRTSLNHIGKKKLDTTELEGALKIPENRSETPESLLERKEVRNKIERAIEQLPETYRVVITLFHLEEMSYQDVADITGMPVGTVKNYLFRGRKHLKELLVSYQDAVLS